MQRPDIKAEFVMAAVKVLDEGVSSADHSDGPQPFETMHRPQSRFHAAVICFNRVVRTLLRDVTGSVRSEAKSREAGLQCWQTRATTHRRNLARALHRCISPIPYERRTYELIDLAPTAPPSPPRRDGPVEQPTFWKNRYPANY
jgi:hypothetical protein